MDRTALMRSLHAMARDIGLGIDELRTACNTHSLRALTTEQLAACVTQLESRLSPAARQRRDDARQELRREHRKQQRAAPGAVRNASAAQRKLIGDLFAQLASLGVCTTADRRAKWLTAKGFPLDIAGGVYTTKTASAVIGALQRYVANESQSRDRGHDARARGGNGAPRPSAVSTEP